MEPAEKQDMKGEDRVTAERLCCPLRLASATGQNRDVLDQILTGVDLRTSQVQEEHLRKQHCS